MNMYFKIFQDMSADAHTVHVYETDKLQHLEKLTSTTLLTIISKYTFLNMKIINYNKY